MSAPSVDDRMIEVAAHLATVLEAVVPIVPEMRDVAAARGRVLRHPVVAAVDVPGFDSSAMDGFAVRGLGELPATLRVVADLPAGAVDDPRLDAGEAARIMTGAPVPSDATAIVPFEDTVHGLAGGLDPVTVVAAPRGVGAHIRRRGSDVRAGDLVVADGVRLTAARVGAIAASGVGMVSVARAPRVAVVSTGSELVPPGGVLRRGQIPESNSVLLAALAEEAGAEVVLRTSVGDEGDGPRRAIVAAEAAGADVVVFSGGVSAGAYEVVKNTLGDLMRFDRVRMQPGKPQGFGRSAAGTLLFGLPGNPVSAAVSFELFVRPALRALEGDVDLGRESLRVALAADRRARPERVQYVPVRLDRRDPARWIAVPTANGTRGLGEADGLAVIPPSIDDVRAGDLVTVTRW
ncbi:molybdopterin molybdotransferase MoeA [Microbacterium trichothecenolyticum]|nr:gephyrin-like molybdotransferase Glp [Microbacterium trichothecenolyticum]